MTILALLLIGISLKVIISEKIQNTKTNQEYKIWIYKSLYKSFLVLLILWVIEAIFSSNTRADYILYVLLFIPLLLQVFYFIFLSFKEDVNSKYLLNGFILLILWIIIAISPVLLFSILHKNVWWDGIVTWALLIIISLPIIIIWIIKDFNFKQALNKQSWIPLANSEINTINLHLSKRNMITNYILIIIIIPACLFGFLILWSFFDWSLGGFTR